MMTLGRITAISGTVLLVTWCSEGLAQDKSDGYWPTWRGPNISGVAPESNPPIHWSETTNIRWKVEVPGRGSASPVIWDDRVFVLTAVPAGSNRKLSQSVGLDPDRVHEFTVIAYDRVDGSVIWKDVAREEQPHEGAHRQNGSWASGSAVTDGEHLFAYFGSRGLYCYTLEGDLIWETDFGDKRMRNEFGEGTTPALAGDTLVIVWDHLGDSFVVALDKRTGVERWRVERDEIDTWATPLIVEHEGRSQVVVGGMKRIVSYDLETGKVVWHSDGLTMNPIPSPVAAGGFIYLTSGYRGNALKAIRLDQASGDITGTSAIAWSLDRDTPYVPSPLLYDDILYVLKGNSGILSAFEAKGGRPHYQAQRLPHISNVFASPVGAADRVYITGRDGATVVLRHGAEFEVLSTNVLEEGFDASPAIAGDELYLRGARHLYSIAVQ